MENTEKQIFELSPEEAKLILKRREEEEKIAKINRMNDIIDSLDGSSGYLIWLRGDRKDGGKKTVGYNLKQFYVKKALKRGGQRATGNYLQLDVAKDDRRGLFGDCLTSQNIFECGATHTPFEVLTYRIADGIFVSEKNATSKNIQEIKNFLISIEKRQIEERISCSKAHIKEYEEEIKVLDKLSLEKIKIKKTGGKNK